MKKLLLLGSAADKLSFIQRLREQSCNLNVNVMRSAGMDMYKLKINNEEVSVWLTMHNDSHLPRHAKANIVILVTPNLKIDLSSDLKNQVIISPRVNEAEIDCVIRVADIKALIRKPPKLKFGLWGLLTGSSTARQTSMQEIAISTLRK